MFDLKLYFFKGYVKLKQCELDRHPFRIIIIASEKRNRLVRAKLSPHSAITGVYEMISGNISLVLVYDHS